MSNNQLSDIALTDALHTSLKNLGAMLSVLRAGGDGGYQCVEGDDLERFVDLTEQEATRTKELATVAMGRLLQRHHDATIKS